MTVTGDVGFGIPAEYSTAPLELVALISTLNAVIVTPVSDALNVTGNVNFEYPITNGVIAERLSETVPIVAVGTNEDGT